MTTQPRPALPAAKNWLGDAAIYWLLARRSLWQDFHRVWLQSHGPLPHPADGPLIIYMNHSSWWDGYLMYVIHRVVLRGRFDAHLLMEERQLRRYRFFTWSGAFSINRHNPEDTRRSQTYAANLLRGGKRARALFIFPQGRIVHPDRRPLVTFPGIARIIAQTGPVTLCPVALRYEFLGHQQPHAFIRIGPVHRPAHPTDEASIINAVAERLTAACDALRDDVVSGNFACYQTLLRGRHGIDQRFDRFLRFCSYG
ncbi:MAG: glycerol acyltransferase [Candidatus Viridilinea halotolerans]|uniref:Glycerol acyltransferase n=1 Tax=Candidatus Viridilinea halotolerans TaxID=2491704 RepID=A0A426U7Q5_9CHLR|nr:MAG: glycerol acyltransferase [Candidatus Viridilinea halotolerans]